MYSKARTKQDAIRALSSGNVQFIDEREVVNDSDTRSLTDFARSQIKRGKKLCVFVLERKDS
jgi:hypothetical protein